MRLAILVSAYGLTITRMTLDKTIDDIMRREGGFVRHPLDRGGPTNFGVTLRTLSAVRGRPATPADVAALSQCEARQIYRTHFYEAPGLERLPASVRPVCFDAAVHHGPARAIRFVQDVCNGAGFGPLTVDGVLGPKTTVAAAAADAAMGPLFLQALIDERRIFMRRIVDADPSQAAFLDGWLKRLDDVALRSLS